MGCIERKAGASMTKKVPMEGAQAEHGGKGLEGVGAVGEDPEAQGSRILGQSLRSRTRDSGIRFCVKARRTTR